MNEPDLTQQETHFAFGRNWADYAMKVTDIEINEAVQGLSRLLGHERLDGKRFLDIGSGSGLHSLAALQLGAREVVAVDIDPDSVSTTHELLSRHAAGKTWRTEQRSIFELFPETYGTFDIVYSWGVLHHTGDLYKAITQAAACVNEKGGRFIVALYRRVWMDWFWRLEKRWYTNASNKAQARARAIYVALLKLALPITGRSISSYIESYHDSRGMDFYHDVHDWMGGWPYESISPIEVEALMSNLDFTPLRVYARKGRFLGKDPGIFGSGCDEYVYHRVR